MARRWMMTLLLASLAVASVRAGETARRRVRLAPLPAGGPASADWVHPEGKTRWDFQAAGGAGSFVTTLESRDGEVSRQTQLPGTPHQRETLFMDAGGAGQSL